MSTKEEAGGSLRLTEEVASTPSADLRDLFRWVRTIRAAVGQTTFIFSFALFERR